MRTRVVPRSVSQSSCASGSVLRASSARRIATSRAINPSYFEPGERVEYQPTTGDRHQTVFLDAGHGGIDPGGDRVAGLNRGADDYLVRPFDFTELVARVHALQRRPPLGAGPVLECADLRFDSATREVTVPGQTVALTAIESSLLELLLRRSPSVLTRRTIATQVWDDEADAVGSDTIDVHVGRVRAKLGGSRARIETVRGIGYRMVET